MTPSGIEPVTFRFVAQHRNHCATQQVIEGKIDGGIEVTGRRGSIRRKLLDDLNERRGYCHMKEEALDRTMWRAALEEALNLS
jgi:hypothetical protein